jgi:hypothetical protein
MESHMASSMKRILTYVPIVIAIVGGIFFFEWGVAHTTVARAVA